MCGIVGAITNPSSDSKEVNVLSFLLSGLSALEYRGYDSAGVAIINAQGLKRCRTRGRVMELIRKTQREALEGYVGIAHTRWATHGEPTEDNAHPHVSGPIAIVHNGIIDNHTSVKQSLMAKGYHFQTQTDSEVIAHLVNDIYQGGKKSLISAIRQAANTLEGIYAFVAIAEDSPQELVGICHGAPLVVGLDKGIQYLASDLGALMSVTPKTRRLQHGDLARLTPHGIEIINAQNVTLGESERPTKVYEVRQAATTLGEYDHYMQKEIFEQPVAIAETLEFYSLELQGLVESLDSKLNQETLKQVENVVIIGCGTSYHAGLTAKYWLESLAKINCSVEIASEYRYRSVVMPKNCLVIAISQSGETADTISALHYAKSLNPLLTMAITNVAHSALVEQVFSPLLTHAGPEIGVASTKAYTTQLSTLALLTIALGLSRGSLAPQEAESLMILLRQVPKAVSDVLLHAPAISKVAETFMSCEHALFLGRGIHYPIALEGALKLKEVSYIHAEAYPSGELKHGPLALVDKHMPVVAVAPNDQLLAKLLSNLEEVRARGGRLIVFSETPALSLQNDRDNNIVLGENSVGVFAPIVNIVPLQLLSYYIAVQRGTDVDRPRNLAKSVTVE